MPPPQAERPFNEREGLEMPRSRFGKDHRVRVEIIDETIGSELDAAPYVAPRQVGHPALNGAEVFTAA